MIVVFDLNGTLVDTQGVHVHALTNILAKYSISVAKSNLADFDKYPLNFFLMRALPANMWEKIPVIASEYIRELSKNATKIKLMPGAVEALEAIKDKKAIFTTLTRPVTHVILENLGIVKYFDLVVTSDDVSRSKPDPEGLILISEKLGDPDLVVVGNSRADMIAAKKYGAVAIFFSPQGETSDAADFNINHLRDLPRIIENIKLMNRSIFKL